MTWTFILVLSPCRSVYSFGGAHARIGNITPWASWRPPAIPRTVRVRASLEVGVRSVTVCGQTYMPRSAHPALRLPSSGRRTVELGARCAARRADAANHCGIGAARDRTCADRAPAAGGARVSLGRPPPPSAARARGHLFGEAARCRLRPRELTVRLLRSKVASSIQAARRVCAQPSVVIKARSTVLSLPVSG
jgi:hypothetical protein